MHHGTRGGFGGPRYGWGAVPGPGTAGSRSQFNNPRHQDWGTGPESGLRRGEWQWRGHGPTAWNDYAWEYRGGFARGDVLARREAALGGRGAMERRLAEQRGGGLPRDRHRFDADGWWDRMAGRRGAYDRGYGRGYDLGW